MKYKVKDGCRIEHNGKSYASGEEVELSADLALFHAANIEVGSEELKAEKAPKVLAAKQDKSKEDVS